MLRQTRVEMNMMMTVEDDGVNQQRVALGIGAVEFKRSRPLTPGGGDDNSQVDTG